jgi:hypothetical protein
MMTPFSFFPNYATLPFRDKPSGSEKVLELFFLRSAQRFFIISDSRFLPAGVRPARFFLLEVAACGAATLRFVPAAAVSDPSNAAMARLSRSLSLFNSATIEWRTRRQQRGSLTASPWSVIIAP